MIKLVDDTELFGDSYEGLQKELKMCNKIGYEIQEKVK